jgi:hypothetical protein
MTNLEFCTARRKAERPAFIRVFQAIPRSRSDYRPDSGVDLNRCGGPWRRGSCGF